LYAYRAEKWELEKGRERRSGLKVLVGDGIPDSTCFSFGAGIYTFFLLEWRRKVLVLMDHEVSWN
jgi:hypothetical protein